MYLENKIYQEIEYLPKYVNVAVIEWEESRRKWIGDISQRPHKMQNDPIIRYYYLLVCLAQ